MQEILSGYPNLKILIIKKLALVLEDVAIRFEYFLRYSALLEFYANHFQMCFLFLVCFKRNNARCSFHELSPCRVRIAV